MCSDLPFSCRCGVVAGRIRRAGPEAGDHVVCHCSDCQRFARRFDAGDRILDEHAGTALYQTRCARLEIEAGKDNLACLHLTEKPTLRWYAACCDTPMFNTHANGRIPYVSTLVANCDADRREAMLGPAVGHLFLNKASGDTRGLPPMTVGGLLLRVLPRVLKDFISGDRRRSPLFDPATLQPIATPRRVSDAE